MRKEFYPNREYNSKRRTKYFVLFAVLVGIFALMDTWMISEKFYVGLFLNVFIVLFIVLTPNVLKTNPVKREPIVKIGDKDITVFDKKIAVSAIRRVKVTVYLGRVGNMVEDREFLEKTAASRPPEGMMGSVEIDYTDKKDTGAYAVVEDVAEALAEIALKVGCNYELGYSLGREYRKNSYPLGEFLAEYKRDKTSTPEIEKSKIKQLI
ncbi:MAG: hypothetical protein J6126_03895 [Clostridia bacterium]|nr:hypothetical protein [Clostridia bacterium]